MRPPPTWLKSSALLVLLGMSVIMPRDASATVIIPADKTHTQATIKDFLIGLRTFHTEYGHWPIALESPPHDSLELPMAGALLKSLIGQETKTNPRGIVFLEPPTAKRGVNGLLQMGQDLSYVDSWGQPLRVVLDTDLDGWVINPDTKNTDPAIRNEAPARLEETMLVYSSGEDGKAQTADDLVSWVDGMRGTVKAPPWYANGPAPTWVSIFILLSAGVIIIWWILAWCARAWAWIEEWIGAIRRGQ
jgi:hypothetical protein